MMKLNLKLLAAAGVLAATAAAVTVSYQWGYSSAQEKAAEKHAQALTDYTARLERDHEESVEILERDHRRALKTARANIEVITQTEEVIRYVEKEIVVPAECTDLSDSVSRVLQQATDIIYRAARAGAD